MGDPQPYVLVVTGSRTWDDVWAVKHHLDQVAAGVHQRAIDEAAQVQLTIRHGRCFPKPTPATGEMPARSADWITHLWIARFAAEFILPADADPDEPGLTAIVEQQMPAAWTAPCQSRCRVEFHEHRQVWAGRSVCTAAGQYRNEEMLNTGPYPNEGLAFLRDKSKGTVGMIKLLKKAGAAGQLPGGYQVIPYDPGQRAPQILAEKGVTAEQQAIDALTAGGLDPKVIK